MSHDKLELDELINFLQFTFDIIKEEAISTGKRESRNEDNLNHQNKDCNISCCVFTYHRVISLIRDQAIAFNVPLSVFSLDNFDPDKELL